MLPNCPSAQEIARRLIVLKYQVDYAHRVVAPARGRGDATRATCEAQRDEFWVRLQEEKLGQVLTPQEREFTQTTVLTMTRESEDDACWYTESIVILLWSLGEVSVVSSYSERTDVKIAQEVPAHRAQKFIRGAMLRPSFEFIRERDIAKFWHWRSEAREHEEAGRKRIGDAKLVNAGFQTWDQLVRFSAGRAYDEGVLEVLIDEDFAVNGKAYRDLSLPEWHDVRRIAVERYRALNWLCGLAPENRWDERSID